MHDTSSFGRVSFSRWTGSDVYMWYLTRPRTTASGVFAIYRSKRRRMVADGV